MSKKVSILIAGFFFLTNCMAASGKNHKVKDYILDASFYPETAYMTGYAGVQLDSLEGSTGGVEFYLHGELTVDSVRYLSRNLELRQEPVYYTYEYSLIANKVTVDLSDAEAPFIEIFYSGHFNPQRARARSDYMCISNDGVFLRSYGYSLWFPIFQESRENGYLVDFSDVTLRTPSEFRSVFVGRKLADYIEDSQRVTEWTASQIELFHVQCSARRWEVLSDDKFHAYYLPDSMSEAQAHRIIKFANSLSSQYRECYRQDADAGEYHIMQLPRYGDISSGNVTGISTEHWLTFAESAWGKPGLAHEMVHPFVMVSIDRSDPLYALGIEGFPSFFHLPILESLLGEEWFDERILRAETQYLKDKAEVESGIGHNLPSEKPIDQITAEEIGEHKDEFVLNNRVILFFNFIREKMGKDGFKDFCRELFSYDDLNDQLFRRLVKEHYSEPHDDIDIWLSTNEYPERFRVGTL